MWCNSFCPGGWTVISKQKWIEYRHPHITTYASSPNFCPFHRGAAFHHSLPSVPVYLCVFLDAMLGEPRQPNLLIAKFVSLCSIPPFSRIAP